jgi:hypothetical protein
MPFLLGYIMMSIVVCMASVGWISFSFYLALLLLSIFLSAYGMVDFSKIPMRGPY